MKWSSWFDFRADIEYLIVCLVCLCICTVMDWQTVQGVPPTPLPRAQWQLAYPGSSELGIFCLLGLFASITQFKSHQICCTRYFFATFLFIILPITWKRTVSIATQSPTPLSSLFALTTVVYECSSECEDVPERKWIAVLIARIHGAKRCHLAGEGSRGSNDKGASSPNAQKFLLKGKTKSDAEEEGKRKVGQRRKVRGEISPGEKKNRCLIWFQMHFYSC